MGPHRARHALLAPVVLGCLAAAGCQGAGTPTALDIQDQQALDGLTAELELALSGSPISTREELVAGITQAAPRVAEDVVGWTGNPLRFTMYQAEGQPSTSPVAVAVWEQREEPFVVADPDAQWRKVCAVLTVDLSAADLRAQPVHCPSELPDNPVGVDLGAAPLTAPAPTTGQLFSGRAASAAAGGLVLSAGPADPARYCADADLALVLEGLSTAGSTTDARVRVVNTSTTACQVGRLSGLAEPAPSPEGGVASGATTWSVSGSDGGFTTLRPKESAVAPLSWRPGPVPEAGQLLGVTVAGGDHRLLLGPGLPPAPLTAPPGSEITSGPWQVQGYGAAGEDHVVQVAIAAPCRADQLGVLTQTESRSTGPASTWAVGLNLGVRACRIDPTGPPEPAGLPPLTLSETAVLVPGGTARLTELRAPLPAGSDGGLLVDGTWVPVEGGSR